MDILTLTTLIAIGGYFLTRQQQHQRIALLGRHLGHYQIEKLMEALMQGYLRALDESAPERRDQIWHLLHLTETQLCEQFQNFATDFARVDEVSARVSRWAIALPFATRLFPRASFDMRKALAIHAQGIARAVANPEDPSPKDRAYTLSAELLLMQHTCHWFCKSRSIASARMLARHQTPHAQLVAAVAPQTRKAYLALLQN